MAPTLGRTADGFRGRVILAGEVPEVLNTSRDGAGCAFQRNHGICQATHSSAWKSGHIVLLEGGVRRMCNEGISTNPLP